MKLENIFTEALFLAPKVYGGKLAGGVEVVKVKGLSTSVTQNEVTVDKLRTLLHKDSSLVFNQTKSFKDFGAGNIKLLQQTYELIPSDNKRQLVYNSEGLLCNTKPSVVPYGRGGSILNGSEVGEGTTQGLVCKYSAFYIF